MPDINPLTNNQIFLKKIAENTGSDYETGDVSEINPLTIDQIFLKEIAANTAGQSGDISELEGKVADNTAAIEAITEVYGAKNDLPFPYFDGTSKTQNEITFTVNSDGSVTANGTATGYAFFDLSRSAHFGYTDIKTYDDGPESNGMYIISDGLQDHDGVGIGYTHNNNSVYIVIYPEVTVSNLTFYPMIRDARITDATYVPYAMTNRELTERVKVTKGTYISDSVIATIAVEKLSGYYLAGVTCNHEGGYMCSFSAHSPTDYYVLIMNYDTINNTISFMKGFETELILTWIKE